MQYDANTLHAGYLKLQTYTGCVIRIAFPRQSWMQEAPQCYFALTLPVLFCSNYAYPTASAWWCNWRRACTTSREVAVSVPGCVTCIFHQQNLLESTQTQTEIITRSISFGGKRDLRRGLTTFSTSCDDCLEIWELQPSWNPQGLSRLVQGLLYLVTFVFFFLWHCSPTRTTASSSFRFLNHKQRSSTVSRTPLDE